MKVSTLNGEQDALAEMFYELTLEVQCTLITKKVSKVRPKCRTAHTEVVAE